MPPPKPPPETRKPFQGRHRSLVIAIDIGTTFSGVSYAILDPGEIPKIHGVTRFPGQEHVVGSTKIPSVIYYDRQGRMKAAGAEADTSAVQARAEDEGWIKAELFKLRLRPRTMRLDMNGMRFGPLPKRKTAVHVFGDFLAYLYHCTRNFITDTHANGSSLWNQVESDVQFVLSHPNGWEGAQQSKMRRAAIYGGLIPGSNEGKARIRFVTEGEASLHACVLNGLAADVLSSPSKHGFLIADAGGGTLDISSYAIKGTSPLIIEEIAPPDCIFAGSVFVSRRLRHFLEGKLRKSKYGDPVTLDHITKRFDETTKRLFRDRGDYQFVPFGSPLDKDLDAGIRGGQLKLTGDEVADLFEPSIDAAFRAIKAQIEASQGMIKSVFLVGGYAASPWLFGQLQERLARYKVTVSRPDTQTSKAVADGAIGFYCDHHVSARVAKFMYGVEFLREMDPQDPDHVARKERLCELPSGPKLLPDAFDCILARGSKVKESTVFTRKYCTELTSLSMLSVFEVEIWCYRGGNTIPKWINRQAEDFSTLCVVRADLSPLAGSAEPQTGKAGKVYWRIVFSVEIQFGLTEFQARIKWVDAGEVKYGPASIIYNERGHRADEDEPDVFPEDEAHTISPNNNTNNNNTNNNTGDRLRSEPVSRSRTPAVEYKRDSVPGSSVGSSRRTSRSGMSVGGGSELSYATTAGGIPDVGRVVDRERSGGGSLESRGMGVGTPSMTSLGTREGESDRRTVSSTRSSRDRDRERDRDRDRERERMDTPRASSSKRSSKIGETLSSVWGPEIPPMASSSSGYGIGGGGEHSRGSSIYGDKSVTRSPRVDQPQQQQQQQSVSQVSSHRSTPSHRSTRTLGGASGGTSSSANRSPYVQTISTSIEAQKNHSPPWEMLTNAVPRSLSQISGHANERDRERERERERGGNGNGEGRMSSLWEDAPKSSYGEPPGTPWNGVGRTSSQHSSQQQQQQQDGTGLLAVVGTPGSFSGSLDLPSSQQQGETTTLSRSLSVSSGMRGGEVPIDADDAPLVGGGGDGWGGGGSVVSSGRSIHIGTPGLGAQEPMTPLNTEPPTFWDNDKTPTSHTVGTVTGTTGSEAVSSPTMSKIPRRSRRGSVGASLLSLQGGMRVPESPNLLAGVSGIGHHHGQQQQQQQQQQQLAPPLESPSVLSRGISSPLNSGGEVLGSGTPLVDQSRGLSGETTVVKVGTPKVSGMKMPKSLGGKTPKTPVSELGAGGKTPKTPAADLVAAGGKTPKTPATNVVNTPSISESVIPPIAIEVSVPTTPITPTTETSVTGKKKKRKGSAAANAAALAAEEEEKRRNKQQQQEAEEEEEERRKAEEEQLRLVKEYEEAEKARLVREAEEEVEKARIAAEEERARIAAEEEEAEKARIAAEEEEAEKARVADAEAAAEAERIAKEIEEEEKLAKELAEAEAAEKEEKKRKEKEAKAAATALAGASAKGKKGKKGKKGQALGLWEDDDEKEKERIAQEAKDAEERAAHELAELKAKKKEEEEKAEREAKEKAEQEAKGKAEQEAKEKAEQEAQEKAEQETKEAAQREAEQKAADEEAKRVDEAKKAEEAKAADSFAPAKGKKGKKKKDTQLNAFDDLPNSPKPEDEMKAKEKEEEDRKAKEEEERKVKEKEEEERLTKLKEEQERAAAEEQKAQEKEKEEKAREKTAMEATAGWGQESQPTSEDAGSKSVFGGWGKDLGGWGAQAKSKVPGLTNKLNAWSSSIFNSSPPQEEMKLDQFGGQTNTGSPSASLFGDMGGALSRKKSGTSFLDFGGGSLAGKNSGASLFGDFNSSGQPVEAKSAFGTSFDAHTLSKQPSRTSITRSIKSPTVDPPLIDATLSAANDAAVTNADPLSTPAPPTDQTAPEAADATATAVAVAEVTAEPTAAEAVADAAATAEPATDAAVPTTPVVDATAPTTPAVEATDPTGEKATEASGDVSGMPETPDPANAEDDSGYPFKSKKAKRKKGKGK